MKAYQPINCNFYDILEATATLRKTAKIVFIEAEKEVVLFSKIIDLYAKDGVEYMVLEKEKTIRLDVLVSVDDQFLEGFSCGI